MVPSPTGMIEDIAVVEERYQLAKWLGIDADAVPTDSVSYTFPWRVWVPCALEDDYETCVSLRFEGNGVFRMYDTISKREVDITAKGGEDDNAEQTSTFLEGRITENLRPLCFFDRPGVLLFSDTFGPGVILHYNHKTARYLVRAAQPHEAEVDPLEMERLVCCVGRQILVKAHALGAQPFCFVQLVAEDDDEHPPRHVSCAHLPDDAVLLCTLRVPDDETLEGLVPIMVRSFPNAASGDSMGMDSMEDDVTMRMPPLFFHIPIDQVVALHSSSSMSMSMSAAGSLFHGLSK